MSNFDFKMMRLDSSFRYKNKNKKRQSQPNNTFCHIRKLCSKLYFRAEAQQIDRILEAFAKRYWECNPRTIFRNSGNCCYDNKGTVNPSFIDTVYAVVYSLLLLNTDLHVAQGNYTRMTRQAFIKNTMTTIKDQPANKNQSFTPTWEAHIESYLKVRLLTKKKSTMSLKTIYRIYIYLSSITKSCILYLSNRSITICLTRFKN